MTSPCSACPYGPAEGVDCASCADDFEDFIAVSGGSAPRRNPATSESFRAALVSVRTSVAGDVTARLAPLQECDSQAQRDARPASFRTGDDSPESLLANACRGNRRGTGTRGEARSVPTGVPHAEVVCEETWSSRGRARHLFVGVVEVLVHDGSRPQTSVSNPTSDANSDDRHHRERRPNSSKANSHPVVAAVSPELAR